MGTRYGANKAISSSEKTRKIENIEIKIRNFTAIKSEFEYLLERYSFIYDSVISKTNKNEPINELTASKSDYFIIYKNNSDCIGDIRTKFLQENIIKTYIMANAILEEFEINNGIIREIEEKEKILSLDPIYVQNIDRNKLKSEIFSLKEQWSDYGNTLRRDNSNLIEYATNSISGLNQEIENLKSEKPKGRLKKRFSFSWRGTGGP